MSASAELWVSRLALARGTLSRSVLMFLCLCLVDFSGQVVAWLLLACVCFGSCCRSDCCWLSNWQGFQVMHKALSLVHSSFCCFFFFFNFFLQESSSWASAQAFVTTDLVPVIMCPFNRMEIPTKGHELLASWAVGEDGCLFCSVVHKVEQSSSSLQSYLMNKALNSWGQWLPATVCDTR